MLMLGNSKEAVCYDFFFFSLKKFPIFWHSLTIAHEFRRTNLVTSRKFHEPKKFEGI